MQFGNPQNNPRSLSVRVPVAPRRNEAWHFPRGQKVLHNLHLSLNSEHWEKSYICFHIPHPNHCTAQKVIACSHKLTICKVGHLVSKHFPARSYDHTMFSIPLCSPLFPKTSHSSNTRRSNGSLNRLKMKILPGFSFILCLKTFWRSLQ